MKFTQSFTFIAILLGLFASSIYSAVIERAPANSLEVRSSNGTTTPTPYGDVVAYQLPDGRRKLDFYEDGVLEGSAIEDDSGAIFYDAHGNVVDLNDDNIAKRQSKWRLAIKFAKLIAKWGKRAWDYIYCVGASSIWRCSDDYIECATHGTPPWQCWEGIICVGSAARNCH